MMYRLIFGMPGTGKTTYVQQKTKGITLDLGQPRDEFQLHQIQHLTTDMINRLKPKRGQWITVDSFPVYFNLHELYSWNIKEVIFLIPYECDEELILNRVRQRDGKSQFYKLYSKKFKEWRRGWQRDYHEWSKVLGLDKVHIYRYVDDGEIFG